MSRTTILLVAFLAVAACGVAQTTHELRVQADTAYQRADAALNNSYKAVMAILDDEQKTLLREAQRAWIPYRDAAIEAASSVYAGGTLAPVMATEASTALTRDQAAMLRALLSDAGPDAPADCAEAERAMRRVYSDYVEDNPDNADKVTGAQEAWQAFRESFLKAVDAIPGGDTAPERRERFCSALAIARTECLKSLFPEGYEPAAAQPEPIAEGPRAPAAPEPTTTEPPEGVPVVKGFYVGMPLRAAVRVMHDHGGLQADWVNDGGTLRWDHIIQEDYQGNPMVEAAQGMLMMWRFTADETERVTEVHLTGPVAAHLFNAKDMEGEEFAQAFVNAYGIDHMETIIVPTDIATQIMTEAEHQIGWQKTDREHGWRITIHANKAVIYEAIATADETAFD
ncbi:MAG: lysozyme inhibitor LprI family protein [Candidatus Hydrogenedentota bacterium]